MVLSTRDRSRRPVRGPAWGSGRGTARGGGWWSLPIVGRRRPSDDIRTRVAEVAVTELVRLGVERSVRSRHSVASVASYRCVGSVASAWSVASVCSAASALSAGSLASFLSTGSILSVASSGSVLSIGSSGGVLSLGGRARRRSQGATDTSTVPADAVRRISGILALSAVVASPWARRCA